MNNIDNLHKIIDLLEKIHSYKTLDFRFDVTVYKGRRWANIVVYQPREEAETEEPKEAFERPEAIFEMRLDLDKDVLKTPKKEGDLSFKKKNEFVVLSDIEVTITRLEKILETLEKK